MDRPETERSTKRPGRAAMIPGVLLVLIAALVAVPVMAIQIAALLGPVDSVKDFDDLSVPSEWADQALFHRPIIDTMHRQWPGIDIVEYDSATAPGYHALMATVLRVTAGPFDSDERANIAPVLVLNVAFGLALVGVVYIFASRLAGPWPAFVLCLPVATSKYILGATAFLTTDNLAWLLVAIALGLAAFSRAKPVSLLGAGLVATLGVGVRQIMVWSAGPAVLAGVLESPLAKLAPKGLVDHPDRPTWRPLLFALIGFACALGLLGVFVLLWGGLVPQASEFVRIHAAGPNLATPAFTLALCGVCGFFYLPLVWDELKRFVLRPLTDAPALLAMLLGLVCAIAVPTSATIDQARETQLWKSRAYGWLWEIVRRAPDIAERSVVITLAAPAGAFGLLLLWRASKRAGRGNEALILLVALLGFVSAQTMNTMAWQRYFEPIVLIVLAWLGALVWRGVSDEPRGLDLRVRAAGPIVLGVVLFALSVLLLVIPMIRHASG